LDEFGKLQIGKQIGKQIIRQIDQQAKEIDKYKTKGIKRKIYMAK
jgi:hypothetical protein